jgi:hypothetical protein
MRAVWQSGADTRVPLTSHSLALVPSHVPCCVGPRRQLHRLDRDSTEMPHPPPWLAPTILLGPFLSRLDNGGGTISRPHSPPHLYLPSHTEPRPTPIALAVCSFVRQRPPPSSCVAPPSEVCKAGQGWSPNCVGAELTSTRTGRPRNPTFTHFAATEYFPRRGPTFLPWRLPVRHLLHVLLAINLVFHTYLIELSHRGGWIRWSTGEMAAVGRGAPQLGSVVGKMTGLPSDGRWTE